MDTRKQRILAAIVKEYSETANPVGSAELAEKYNFKESPATIRNEMGQLEKAGFIYQPHKSAGRIPTNKGYRFFINELMRRFEMSERERKLLRSELHKLKVEHEQLGRKLSNLIAESSGQAAFAFLPSHTSITGLSHLIGQPEFSDSNEVKEVARMFENIDTHAQKLLSEPSNSKETVEVFIGKESPLPVPENMSLVISKVKLPKGKRGVIGIIGPKRMGYAKNLSLLEYLSKLISGSAVILLLIYM